LHVSYRKGNTILWSKKKVLLRKGEKILTDGTTQIRSRCGNCISDEPLAPTAADEPDVVEFDRLVDAFDPLAAAPQTGSANTAADPISAGLAGAAGGPSAGTSMGVAGGAAPLGGGGAGGSGVPLVAATRSGNREPGDPSDPFAGDPEGSAFVELLTSGGNGLPTLDELLPPGPNQPNGPDGPTSENPPIPTDNDPVNPVPVPEPGTFCSLAVVWPRLVRRTIRLRRR
jgi:hypothetical protein